MEQIWFLAPLWLGLTLVALLLARWFHIRTALSEIVVGTVAQLFIGALAWRGRFHPLWATLLIGTWVIVLTFVDLQEIR